MATITALTERMTDLLSRNQAIEAESISAGRDLSEDEQAEIRANIHEWNDKNEQLNLLNEISNQANHMAQSAGRQTTPDGPDDDDDAIQAQPSQAPVAAAKPAAVKGRVKAGTQKPSGGARPIIQVGQNQAYARAGGFTSPHGFGDFVQAVANARGGVVDQRLSDIRNQPAQFGSEGSGAQGGFAVPPTFLTPIVDAIMGQDSLLGRTMQMTTSTNSLTMPVDAVAPWDNTQGVTVNGVLEGAQKPASRPLLETFQTTVHKLVSLVPMTDELLSDSPALNAWLQQVIPQKFTHAINNLLLNGTGTNEAQGILNSGELVTAPIAAGQTVGNPILFENIRTMRSRMYGPWRNNAVWVVHQDIESQLDAMQFLDGAPSPVPVYMPANGISGNPFGTLYGRPVISCQECQAVGTPGDIYLWDPSRYVSLTHRTGMQSDVSVHLFFDFDMTTFRFVMRIGGRTLLQAPTAQRNGGNTLSSVIALDTRA